MLRTFEIEEELYYKFKLTCVREGDYVTRKIRNMIESYVKEHADSNNPQTVIETFDKEDITAIPTIYEKNIQPWKKFYNLLSKDDYKELDKQISWLFNYHNSQFTKVMDKK